MYIIENMFKLLSSFIPSSPRSVSHVVDKCSLKVLAESYYLPPLVTHVWKSSVSSLSPLTALHLPSLVCEGCLHPTFPAFFHHPLCLAQKALFSWEVDLHFCLSQFSTFKAPLKYHIFHADVPPFPQQDGILLAGCCVHSTESLSPDSILCSDLYVLILFPS